MLSELDHLETKHTRMYDVFHCVGRDQICDPDRLIHGRKNH